MLLPVVAIGAFFPIVLVAVTTGWLVYQDAAARDASNPLSRAVSAGLLPVPSGIQYYWNRRDLGPRESSVSDAERYAGVLWFVGVLALLAGAVLSPPDPFSVGLYAIYSVLPAAIVGYLFVFVTEWAYRGSAPN
ncbi:hypothetical protein [Halovivax limisalsi]|uniref:hypothetical protein n=1 Tax=Halovivax limisalsi TaxID=1453760 RepID=UPI001FFC62CB|nr:hypothetical protein [Halovivax limisalsi]